MSHWAFFQCHNGNDTKEMRDLITHPHWINMYRYYIGYDSKMKKEFRKNYLNK